VQDGEEKEIGDPTETAIIRLLKNKHIEKESLLSIHPKVHEIPFDSDRKLMTTVHGTGDLDDITRYISITKGAFESRRLPGSNNPCPYDGGRSVCSYEISE